MKGGKAGVISMYKWHQVKILNEQGKGVKAIARELQISRNTVRKYLRNQSPPIFSKKQYVKILDCYENEIESMLKKGFIGTRICSELQELGYTGSLSTIHKYIKKLIRDNQINKSITTRVETLPGEQMQYDWKEWTLKVGDSFKKIYIHELILSYSRKKHYAYSLSITTEDIIRAINQGIDSFGGIAPELVIDNPKQMVINHSKDDIVRYNDQFLKFCGLYGINPSACQNYRPRTKGKVERPFYYLQEHFLRGLEVRNLSELEENLKIFTNKYNEREHSSLKESPQIRYLREKEHLKPIPQIEPTILFKREFRQVSNDGYISYSGKFYPVPMKFCFKSVLIESIWGRKLKIYDVNGSLLSEYPLSESCLKPPHPEHQEMNQIYKDKKALKKAGIKKRFTDIFGDTGKIYMENLETFVGHNSYWHIKEIINFTQIYTEQDVRNALDDCIGLGIFHKNSVKRLLNLKNPQTIIPETTLSLNLPSNVNIKRDLSVYKIGGSR